MQEVNNFFVKTQVYGEFTVTDGKLESSFISNNQYFLIDGSIFNDGLYLKGKESLTDETFNGTVSALAIPQAFLDLVSEIDEWQGKYSDAVQSPYQSESFGGYSYSKVSSSSDGADKTTWQGVFKDRLNHWRKL